MARKFSWVRDNKPPPSIDEGAVIAAAIRSYQIVDSKFKNADGSTKQQVKFSLEYEGYEFFAWISYYKRPFKSAKIVTLAEALYHVTHKTSRNVDEALRDLADYGYLYVQCTGHRVWEDVRYPKFTVIADRLPPKQTALPSASLDQVHTQPKQRIRFVRFYGAYNVDDVEELAKTVADNLIERGVAVPLDETVPEDVA
jgi:hypothetical protein